MYCGGIMEAFKHACATNDLETVERLLQIDISISASDDDYGIMIASINRHHRIVKLVYKYGMHTAYLDLTNPLAWACRNNHHEIVIRLLEDHEIDPNKSDGKAFFEACFEGHVSIVELLLRCPRVDLTYGLALKGLQFACYRGNMDVVKLLLSDPRIDPTYDNNLVICITKSPDIVALLLQDPRVDPNADCYRPLCSASRDGNVGKVQALLQHPSIVVNDYIVSYAEKKGHYDIINILKDKLYLK